MSEMRGTISVLQNGTNISKSENHGGIHGGRDEKETIKIKATALQELRPREEYHRR
jgi:hypothetical protein